MSPLVARMKTSIVMGHRGIVIFDLAHYPYVEEFPHKCPGLGCAIGEWAHEKWARRIYESLKVNKERAE